MKRYLTMDELRRSEFESLKLLRDFCTEHGLRYYLACGTLLGAVRHQGFIPWDDDVDVYMPRKDYEYLLAHFHAEQHKVISRESDAAFYLNSARIIDTATVWVATGKDFPVGAYIDIFPIDYYPESIPARLRVFRFWILNRVYLSYDKVDLPGYPPLKLAFIHVCRFAVKCVYRSRERLWRRVRMIWEQFSRLPQNDCYTLLYRNFGCIPRLPVQWFEPAEMLTFEGESFAAPKEYHKYLTGAYGDYMQLPPEEKRVSRHSFECYWAEENDDESTDSRSV